MDRKTFFSKGLLDIAKGLWKTPVGKSVDKRMHGLANLLDPIELSQFLPNQDGNINVNDFYVRPPGAISFDDFTDACTKCGDCIQACPHHSIFELEEDGPVLNPNRLACHLCVDFPCIDACKEDALHSLGKGVLPYFGTVKVEKDLCINSFSNSRQEDGCHECVDSCPVEGAIDQPSFANIPQIKQNCTGCGLCVEACPVFPIALEVVEVENEK